MSSSVVAPVQAPPRGEAPRLLADLRRGEQAVVDHIELPESDARRLMELGFVPGVSVVYLRSSPFGDPRIFRVDGSDIAVRRETARLIAVREAQ